MAEEYFHQNRDRLDKAARNIENLLAGTLPIDADAVDYEFHPQRMRRIMLEIGEILNRDGNENWSITGGFISEDLKHPSVLKGNLKNSISLPVTDAGRHYLLFEHDSSR